MTVINSNSAAMRAQNSSRLAASALSTAMERLSSGKRINSAVDDAAGLAITNSMTAQINGLSQAIRNANDGISMLQTADGALDEVTNMAQRVRELAVQSASGTYSEGDRDNMQAEVTGLTAQMKSILTDTKFNGNGLFDTTAGGSGNTVDIQSGAGSTGTDKITVKIGNLDVSGLDATPGTGFLVSETTANAGDGAANATSTMANADTFLDKVATVRAGIGASESRMNSVVNNLTTIVTNLTDSRSRIADADFSAETTNLAKAQILSQASTAMLAQANQSQQGVMKLLQ